MSAPPKVPIMQASGKSILPPHHPAHPDASLMPIFRPLPVARGTKIRVQPLPVTPKTPPLKVRPL